MKFAGQLKSWNAQRGFGFIAPVGGGQEIFFHISAVPTQLRPPKVGQQLTFEVELDREGKKRAVHVGAQAAPRRRRQRSPNYPAPWSVASAMAIPAFVAIYMVVAFTRGVSIWFAEAYVALSVICMLAYAFDKSAAIAGRWRSSEESLLLLGLAGGWPGGLLAQQLLRHKSSKASFRRVFWATVVLNVTGFILFHLYFHPGQIS